MTDRILSNFACGPTAGSVHGNPLRDRFMDHIFHGRYAGQAWDGGFPDIENSDSTVQIRSNANGLSTSEDERHPCEGVKGQVVVECSPYGKFGSADTTGALLPEKWRTDLRSMSLHAVVLLLILSVSTVSAQEITRIASSDGEQIVGRLCMPESGFTNKIVIDVPSTGPHTYLDRRQVGRSLLFNYHDLFAEEFNRRGIAYFSYSTRYTESDTLPPYFDNVIKDKFITYTPSMKIKDLEAIVKFLKQDARLKSSRFVLLGQSEGTIIATSLVENGSVSVDALLLCGTPSDDVYSTIRWQLSGEASMINFRKFFDTNGDSIIQREEYDNGDQRALKRVGDMSFAALDVNEDSRLTAEDFRLRLRPRLDAVTGAIEHHDDEWIWNNFFRVGIDWIAEHRDLAPNSERILNLDIPIFIFHGDDDANCPVKGIRKLAEAAKAKGKANIHVFTFAEHDHSLEFLGWVIRKTMPEGLRKLFDTAERL